MKRGAKIALWSVGGLIGLYLVLTVIAWLVIMPGRRERQARLDGALKILREGIIAGRKMALNKSEGASSGIEVSSYLEKYMAKNLYWMGVEAEYRFNTETIRPRIASIALTPPGFTIREQQAQFYEYVTHNAKKIWQP